MLFINPSRLKISEESFSFSVWIVIFGKLYHSIHFRSHSLMSSSRTHFLLWRVKWEECLYFYAISYNISTLNIESLWVTCSQVNLINFLIQLGIVSMQLVHIINMQIIRSNTNIQIQRWLYRNASSWTSLSIREIFLKNVAKFNYFVAYESSSRIYK